MHDHFDPGHGVRHLRPEHWTRVTRAHIAKMIGEFVHERLLSPRPEGGPDPRVYVLDADHPTTRYRFEARTWMLDHWEVDPDSVTRLCEGEATLLDSLEFILDFREQLGISDQTLPGYLEEMSASLYADAYKRASQRFTARELAAAPFQAVETSMTAGHPCFVVNAGRLGYDTDDYLRYAPEVAQPVRLVWLAASRSRATFAAVEGLSYEHLIDEELDYDTRRCFETTLQSRGLRPERYLYIPVHPWQWSNRLCTVLAGDLARGDLVMLGHSNDDYQPQQSIRTLYNLSRPQRCYVKTALSIVNMGFVRGLSPDYMVGTPAINQWVDELVRRDPTLQRSGFTILREIATVGYRSPAFERAGPRASPYNKMLAALWRESPWTKVQMQSHRLVTMASLLHVDRDGQPLLPQLVAGSGLEPEAWLRRYLGVYLTPLLHCYYAHDLVFMPHGENVLLELDAGVPVRVLMKDIAEEVAVFEGGDALPPQARRIAIHVPPPLRNQAFFMDVFDCFFRFLAPIAERGCGVPEASFWRLVAETIRCYRHEHPEIAPRMDQDDLFVPRFRLSCSNRLQLRNARQLLDLADPSAGLQFAGELDNPLAPFRAPQ